MTYYPENITNEKGIIIKNTESEYEFGIETNVDLFSKYSDISTFINESRYGIIYKNAFGKNTMLQSYPTSLGSRNEVVISKKCDIQKFNFWMSLNDCSLRLEPGGYILIISNKKNEDGKEIITGIVQPPILKDKNGFASLKSRLKIISLTFYYRQTAHFFPFEQKLFSNNVICFSKRVIFVVI